MVNSIVLASSMRNNLLSIVNTQRLLDNTTLRLATGREVNSALDNPQNFFTAASLDNRASDLGRLLDGINLSIRTVQEADNGIRALTKLVEQADAIAQQAVELSASSSTEARINGDKDLSNVILTSIAGINAGDTIQISLRDPDSIVYFPPFATITINPGATIDQVIADINAFNTLVPQPVIEASLNNAGQFEIAALAGDILSINFVAAAPSDAANLNLAGSLGFSKTAKLLETGTLGVNAVNVTVVPTRTLTSFELFDAATNRVARRSDRVALLEGASNTLLFFGLNAPADAFEIGINGGSRQSILLDNTQTIQGLIDGINNNGSLNNFLRADFIEETGQLTIEAINPAVESVETALEGDGVAVAFFGFNHTVPLRITDLDADTIRLGTATGPSLDEIRALEGNYNDVLTEIDNVVEDAKFRGVNLLGDDNLVSFFNEDRTNSLVTESVDFTFSGLGFERADFRTQAGSASAVNDALNALERVREFGQSIATDLSVIEIRRSFIEKSINTLGSGADDLVNADLNEEGANMLALQTRQALSVTVLSIGAQQQTSILRIF